MSYSRKEFEAWANDYFETGCICSVEWSDQYNEFTNAEVQHAWMAWQAALSVAPAPVAAASDLVERLKAAQHGCGLANYNGTHAFATIPQVLKKAELALGEAIAALSAPPVQEGPKGVEAVPDVTTQCAACGKICGASGLCGICEISTRIHPYGYVSPRKTFYLATEAAIQSPKVRRDLGLVAVYTSPAQSIPAAIDEEGRQAIEAGIRALFVADDLPLDEQAKHAAALKRLLSGN